MTISKKKYDELHASLQGAVKKRLSVLSAEITSLDKAAATMAQLLEQLCPLGVHGRADGPDWKLPPRSGGIAVNLVLPKTRGLLHVNVEYTGTIRLSMHSHGAACQRRDHTQSVRVAHDVVARWIDGDEEDA